jgi:Nucleotidyl transferase AbiEii toxin, Type IV TA system
MGDPTGLSDDQRSTLDRLSALPVMRDFYLAGGSALAIHLAHRRSLDLDFFSKSPTAHLDVINQVFSIALIG